jgi:hypothetical protein
VPVKRRTGHGGRIHGLQKAIDGIGTAVGLLFFQFDGRCDDLGTDTAGLSPIAARLSFKTVESLLPVMVQLAPQRGQRWPFDASVREADRLLGQRFEKPVRRLLVDLPEDQWF